MMTTTEPTQEPARTVPAMLTRNEVARALRCGPKGVTSLVKAGQLRARKVGKRHLFAEADVAAFLDAAATA
jgi:excisionase family DNA binding protein